MNFQHFRVKCFAAAESKPDLHHAIPVFHRWIREKWLPENTIDVSDYLHVPGGPGVILVCHEGIYGLDLEKNHLGMLYNRRTALDGNVTDRLQQAVDAAWRAASRMEKEPEFAGHLKFNHLAWEVAVNDRALAPNSADTLGHLQASLIGVFRPMFGSEPVVRHNSGPGELFRVRVSAA